MIPTALPRCSLESPGNPPLRRAGRVTRVTARWLLACAFALPAVAASAGEAPPAAELPPGFAPPAAAATEAASARAPAAQTYVAPPPNASDLAAYLAAVESHLQHDPALAAAYTVFWSELRETARTGKALVDLVPETFAQIATSGREVADSVRAHYRGLPPGYAAGEALRVALLALAQQSDRQAPGSTAERLLANLDRSVAPRVNVDGRYEYAGNLQGAADLGFGAEVWLLCRQSKACIEAHDQLFAQAMAGASLADALQQRLSRDALLAAAPQLPPLLAAAAELDARLAAAGGQAASLREVAGLAARDYWRTIATEVAAGVPPTPGSVPPTPGQAATPGTAAPTTDPYGLDALFTLGRAGAYLAGQEALANAFAVTREPVMEFASAVTQGALLGTLGSSAASLGLLFAGVQALALFDDLVPEKHSEAPQELRQLVLELNDATYRSLQSARAEQMLATNAVDTRVAAMGVALDVVKTDVARLESATRRRIGSDYQAAAARRWTEFDENNERCFSLRNRDPRTGQLRAGEFRRCEDRFLQGATRRSHYATRATEYVLDARFIEPGDVRFPFHDHYPLLATLGGLDSRAALALPDPLDWQQNAAALLRLYQENPAKPGDARKRREALAAVAAAGSRVRQALLGMTLQQSPDGSARFRDDVHHKALHDYFAALEQLVVRVGMLDDPAAHTYGKRATEGLEQPVPGGAKRAAIEATLSGAAADRNRIGSCADAPASAFEPQPDRLLAESRRFFGDPVQPAELVAAWNRQVVDDMALQPGSYVDLVPTPYLWSALEGLGRLEFCFAQFRPEAVAFTRDRGPVDGTLLGSTVVGAELEVRFVPDPAVARNAGLQGDGRTAVARFSADRACMFGYRNDDQPCSRAACLPQLAPLLWRDDDRTLGNQARCDGEPLADLLPRRGAFAEGPAVATLRETLERAWLERQSARLAQLEADAARSTEYERASAAYLTYYALAGVTLGTYPDGAEALGGLFGPSQPLAPRDAIDALLKQRIPPAALLEQFRQRSAKVQAAAATRGQQLAASGNVWEFPHLRALTETLTRLDLAAAAYAEG